MNRQEAYRKLKEFLARYYELLGEKYHYYEMAHILNALKHPTPDPITGLVPR